MLNHAPTLRDSAEMTHSLQMSGTSASLHAHKVPLGDLSICSNVLGGDLINLVDARPEQ